VVIHSAIAGRRNQPETLRECARAATGGISPLSRTGQPVRR
jgi:hypothetical protein